MQTLVDLLGGVLIDRELHATVRKNRKASEVLDSVIRKMLDK